MSLTPDSVTERTTTVVIGTGLSGLAVASELSRYMPILFGQYRERIAFLRQDLAMTALLVLLIVVFSFIRYEAGYGTAFDGALEAFRS